MNNTLKQEAFYYRDKPEPDLEALAENTVLKSKAKSFKVIPDSDVSDFDDKAQVSMELINTVANSARDLGNVSLEDIAVPHDSRPFDPCLIVTIPEAAREAVKTTNALQGN